MNILLYRHSYSPTFTLGTLYVDDAIECFTLEDPDRLALGFKKIAGETAIPAGEYAIVNTWSPKFRRIMPLVVGVPGFTGIRIHIGNVAAETEGCILTGQRLDKGRILSSRAAFEPLRSQLMAAEREGGVSISIVQGKFPSSVEKACVAAWEKQGGRMKPTPEELAFVDKLHVRKLHDEGKL